MAGCRKQETEADAIGLQLAAKACYDPAGALGAFKKLGAAEKKEGVSAPMMLRTHPLSTVHPYFPFTLKRLLNRLAAAVAVLAVGVVWA